MNKQILVVEITPRAADVLLELWTHTVEASDEEIDEELDDDIAKFSESVRAAKRRVRK